MAYRFYVTDCLQILTLNIAKRMGGEYADTRYRDIIAPNPKYADDRTVEQIIADVVRRAGLEVV